LVEVLVTLIRLGSFLEQKNYISEIGIVYNNIDSIKEIFTIEEFNTIFDENSNFILSIKLTNSKDYLNNRIISIKPEILLKKF
jgi:hypothetical protein